MDILDVIRAGHASLGAALDRLEAAEQPVARGLLLGAAARLLRDQVALEEQVFYPEFRRCARDDGDLALFFSALEQHCDAAEIQLAALERTPPADPSWAARLQALRDCVRRHQHAESEQVLARAAQLLSADRRRRLAKRARQLMHAQPGRPRPLAA